MQAVALLWESVSENKAGKLEKQEGMVSEEISAMENKPSALHQEVGMSR